MDDTDSNEWIADDRRVRLVEWLQDRDGAYYLWNTDGHELPASAWMDVGLEPPACRQVFDCSGLICAAVLAMGGPDWRATRTSAILFDKLEPVTLQNAAPGDLLFYRGLGGSIEHVMVYMDGGRAFGACGGGRKTTTLLAAHQADKGRGARVRARSSHLYRPGFAGCRKFPFPPLKEQPHA